VSIGKGHYAALVEENGQTEVYTWGLGQKRVFIFARFYFSRIVLSNNRNSLTLCRGQLGHGNCESEPAPKLVKALSGKLIVRVACGDDHTAAVSSDGKLYVSYSN
jgi:alpha-tubulin suppressor-like RCC1 family protein